MFTSHSSITTVGIVVRIGVAAAAVQKSWFITIAVQMRQKNGATSSTKCTAADIGVCN